MFGGVVDIERGVWLTYGVFRMDIDDRTWFAR